MTHRQSISLIAGMVAAVSLLAGLASAQSPTMNLALRTPGPVLRSGECIRVDMVGLDDVYGPFEARVAYRFADSVVVRDEHGAERRDPIERRVERPSGPVMDVLRRTQSVLIDDTFCIGQSSPAGPYQVEVALGLPGGGSAGTLRTCVYVDDGAAVPADAGCTFAVTGLVRADSPESLVFDGRFPALGSYRALLMRGTHVEVLLELGVAAAGPDTLLLNSPNLERLGRVPVDLVVHDQTSGRSATLARLVLPGAR